MNISEVGMLYTIGADGDLGEEFERVAASDLGNYIVIAGADKAYAKVAAILNKWYCEANGGEPYTEKDFLLLPFGDFSVLQEKVVDAILTGQKQTVKTKKQKNAKAADTT